MVFCQKIAIDIKTDIQYKIVNLQYCPVPVGQLGR